MRKGTESGDFVELLLSVFFFFEQEVLSDL